MDSGAVGSTADEMPDVSDTDMNMHIVTSSSSFAGAFLFCTDCLGFSFI